MSESGAGKTRRSRVLYVTERKDAATVGRAKEWLESRQVKLEPITTACADMSPAFAKGVDEHFPKAQLVFDNFYVVSGVSSAVDAVRRRERQTFPELLKGTRWLWLKGEDKLIGEQRETRRRLCRRKLQTGRAHGHPEALRDLMKQKRAPAERDLQLWCGCTGMASWRICARGWPTGRPRRSTGSSRRSSARAGAFERSSISGA